jgi:hypothetical protein
MKKITVEVQDIKSIIHFLEGDVERKTIINFIKEYVYKEKPKKIMGYGLKIKTKE